MGSLRFWKPWKPYIFYLDCHISPWGTVQSCRSSSFLSPASSRQLVAGSYSKTTIETFTASLSTSRLSLITNICNNFFCLDMGSRARWKSYNITQIGQNLLSHIVFYVKLNFKMGLFSSIFWSEDSLLCKIASFGLDQTLVTFTFLNQDLKCSKMKIIKKRTQKWQKMKSNLKKGTSSAGMESRHHFYNSNFCQKWALQPLISFLALLSAFFDDFHFCLLLALMQEGKSDQNEKCNFAKYEVLRSKN